MNLVQRVIAILLRPKAEWPAIAREPGEARYLFLNYVAILAAIGPVCGFIGGSVIGFGPFRVSLIDGLIYALVSYAITLIGVFAMATIIDLLAGPFGAQKNFANAMRVSAYAPTAAWLAAVFNLVPALAVLTLLGLYSLYLLYTGIVALMKPPARLALAYTIVVVVCVIVVWVALFAVFSAIFGMNMIV